jgi:chromosome segregation ATPase
MRKILITVSVVVTLAGTFGCRPISSESGSKDSTAQDIFDLRRENKKLTKENEELKTKLTVHAARTKELQERESHLAGKVARMQREIGKLKEQIDVLKHAPADRDRYRAESHKAKMIIVELRREIRQMQKKLDELKAK